MAVTKIWAIHDSVSRVVDYCTNPSKTKLSDLEQVLLYAADKEKNLDEGEQQYAVTGIGCRAESAAREMAAVQRRFGKAGGNVAYHAYQSFKTGEVTAEECHRIGVETARRLWGNDRQVLVATHFNTGTYHNYFVVNPVNMWTGKKLEAKYEVYYKLRDMSDRICKEHGLSVVKNPQRHKTARSVYFAEKNDEPTRYNLMRRALDECLVTMEVVPMTKIEIQTLYEVMFTDYPDIVNVAQVQAMLGISRHLAYALIGDGDIPGMKIGNAYRVPKINVIRYALSAGNPQPAA